MKRFIAAAAVFSLTMGLGAWAQEDDFDLDAMLGDFDAPAAEEAADTAADAAAGVAEAADEFAAAADDFAEAADVEVEEVAAVEEDPFAGFGDIPDAGESDAFAGAPVADAAEGFEEIAEVAEVAEEDPFADIAAEPAPVAQAPAPAADDFMDGLFDDDSSGTAAEEDVADAFAGDFAPADDGFDAAADAADADEDFGSFAAGDDDFETPAAPAAASPRRAAAAEPELSPAELKKLAKELAKQEEIRRQSDEADALKASTEGFRQLKEEDYAAADASFTTALAKLPDRPQNADARANISWGLAEAKYLRARSLVQKNERLPEARTYVDAALKTFPGHPGALNLDKKLQKLEAQALLPVPPAKQQGTVDKFKKTEDLYREARQWYRLRDFDRAKALFDQILVLDPYHKAAMRYLRKIELEKYDVATVNFAASRQGMVTEVRQSFSRPVSAQIDLPGESAPGQAVDSRVDGDRLNEKMAKLIIPSVEFRQANISDVVNFLVDASIAADPEKEGVNIILNLGDGGSAAAAPAPAATASDGFDDWGDFGGDDFGAAASTGSSFSGGTGGVSPITLNLRRISMLDAIKYITEVAGLKYRVEDQAVIITRMDAPVGKLVTRMYPVQPSFMDVVIERQGSTADERNEEFVGLGGRVQTTRSEVKDFFEKAGVKFPTGATISYNSAISQLIVNNTPDNLETFERILQQINVVPNQVEIEARFIEINQNDLEELGFQWILNDNYEIASKKDGSGAQIRMNANANGLTQGNRFFATDSDKGLIAPVSAVTKTATQSTLGNIASFSSVLTNPDVTMVIQALSQHGGSDLLSAPRVTTRSGVNAQIQVVREIIYPMEFDSEIITIDQENEAGNTWQQLAAVNTPGDFQTRETGVILNVTPTVGPDGYTIDLVMAPEVCELDDWIQYGGAVGDYFFNQPMPVFTSRNVTTSLVIWDGQTVVMGGLIREELVTVKDKIPILGDIPLLGWLFRSEGSYSQKKNLLIFVTARLVDPAGRPVHQEGTMALPGAGIETAADEG
jgi:general secretion pathway protein D